MVVLYPSAANAATAPSLLQASPTIEQERMRFVPALTVVAPGTTLRFTNQDRWDHHARHAGGPAATGAGRGNEGFEMRLAGKQTGRPPRRPRPPCASLACCCWVATCTAPCAAMCL